MEFRKIEQIRVSELIPYEKNAKIHDERQIQNVAESIKRYGFVQPVVVDKNNVIVIGHCRVSATKLLELESVPCMRIEDLNKEIVAGSLKIILSPFEAAAGNGCRFHLRKVSEKSVAKRKGACYNERATKTIRVVQTVRH